MLQSFINTCMLSRSMYNMILSQQQKLSAFDSGRSFGCPCTAKKQRTQTSPCLIKVPPFIPSDNSICTLVAETATTASVDFSLLRPFPFCLLSTIRLRFLRQQLQLQMPPPSISILLAVLLLSELATSQTTMTATAKSLGST